MITQDDSQTILELACASANRHLFQREALALAMRCVVSAGGFFVGLGAPGTRALNASIAVAGFGPNYVARLKSGMSIYGGELASVKARALSQQGVVVDTKVLGLRARQTCYYQELVRPHGGGPSLLCFLELRGRPLGVLMLGRESGARFGEHEPARLRALRPALTLGLASFGTSNYHQTRALHLSERERTLCGYVTRGFTNREIALGLGTSPNTVRNQLAAIFRKAEVTTRAELVGQLLGAS